MIPTNDFRILRHLGSGEWTQSYLMEYPSGLRAVARTLRPGAPTEAAGALAASTLAGFNLRVKGVRPALDLFGEGEDTIAVFEYLTGQSLAAKLASEGPLNIREAVHITRKVAAIVAEIQEKGVIQRDLRPENIWLCPNGEITLMDAAPARPYLEPALAAPEQLSARGEASMETDVYALGMLLYVMLTGEPPFSADFPDQRELELRVLGKALPRLSHMPLWLDDLIQRATNKHPLHRFQTAAAFAAELAASEAENFPGRNNRTLSFSLIATLIASLLPSWFNQWFV